ncbi:gamma-glutamyl-gamma-aminobutyrate hydrolase family protein [Acuticoccus sp. MNP-M23]|uniref:gamma-glutamyl-gamma-aminobutyrate hydrolase family protein n=1 Tax=Acuticoccus sp. MNP-M23 TaxID=3072793 RepID=UPI0028150666|nr:gamma-glutamyl-gamma-aminobutyrate hydrolase family protein [Acuticoccus sp. MNP-M23]WMS41098.1 gamma-glutamyl-gamma-aminobutyrate hydrolase family protein [Acuticoccus sp. MNP-M23]
MAPPMVLVSCDRFERNDLVWSGGPASYLEAAAVVGLLPVQLPTISEPIDPAPLLDVCAGVLITGARANVHPSHYGAEESEAAAPFDPARDRTTLPLIREAVARGIPLFCICRGIQEMNVAFGGSLHHSVHALPGRDDHRSPQQPDVDAWFGLRHDIEIRDGGLLRPILGERVRVNSVHHQGIDRLAERAHVEAVAPDGTIEAISIRGAAAFALGVQWHPEHFVKSDGPSRAVFEAFAQAVVAYANQSKARAA